MTDLAPDRTAKLVSRFSLAGRVALVSGGSAGIGKAIALGFAEAGAEVAVVGRSAERLKDTVQALAPLLDCPKETWDALMEGQRQGLLRTQS